MTDERPDFDTMTLGKAVEPAQLVRGTYSVRGDSVELGESSQKKTPFYQFPFTILSVEDVDDDELEAAGGAAELVGKRVSSDRFYISEKALFNLKRFTKGLGIDYDAELEGKTLSEGRDILQEQVEGEEFEVFIVRQPQESYGKPRLDDDGNVITRAVVSRISQAA